MYDNDFMQQWPAFRTWLKQNGCQILEPTNPYEVVRFTTPEGVGVVYRKQSGRISRMTGGAELLYWAWKEGRKFEFAMRIPREKRCDKKREQLIQKIAKRDGWTCVFCGALLDRETATIERIVALATKGVDHIANMTLACEDHSNIAGHMSAREKIEYAISNRAVPF